MSHQSQLTFQTDLSYIEYQSIFRAIEEGRFEQAYELCEKTLSLKIKIENLFLIMKSLKFWLGRKKIYYQKKSGKEQYEYLILQWQEFKNFTAKYQEYVHDIFFLFKKSIYQQICENALIEYQSNENEEEVLLTLTKSLLVLEKYDDALELLLYCEKKSQKYFDFPRSYLLSQIYTQKNENFKSLFYISHCFLDNWYLKKEKNYKQFNNPYYLEIVQSMYYQGFNEKEIEFWLPIYLFLELLPQPKFNPTDLFHKPLAKIKHFLKESLKDKQLQYEKKDILSHKLDFIFTCVFSISFYLGLKNISTEDYRYLKELLIIIKQLDSFIYSKLKNIILKRQASTE